MSTKKTNQEQALEKFVGYVGANIALCEAITEFLEDHTGENPDDINFGHVGNMVHTNELLKEIIEFLQIKVKE